jgi:hypothetical protein
LLSEQGVIALEGSSIHPEVKQKLRPHVIASALEIRPGTLYPTPEWIHIRATTDALTTLNELVNTLAGPEICNHLYAYERGTLLLEWHDAFDDSISRRGHGLGRGDGGVLLGARRGSRETIAADECVNAHRPGRIKTEPQARVARSVLAHSGAQTPIACGIGS